jgi:hypothetical protein
VDLKLGHHARDGIEVIEVQGEIDMYTAPRLRELLIDLAGKGSYQLVVNLDKVGFLDSTGLGVLTWIRPAAAARLIPPRHRPRLHPAHRRRPRQGPRPAPHRPLTSENSTACPDSGVSGRYPL